MVSRIACTSRRRRSEVPECGDARPGRRVFLQRLSTTALVFVAAAIPAIGAEPPSLTVFAAADLAFALKEILPLFEKAHGAKVTLSLGSTGNLAAQIENGAPADVFFAADQAFVERLAARGAVIPETRTLYARGRIVLATPKSGRRLKHLRDLLDPDVRRVAIANPLHAPYGKAAEEAMRAVGVWDTLKPKLVYGENIRQTLQFLQVGAVDAGIVSLSVASAPEIEWTLIDDGLHAPLNQAAAVVRRSRHVALAVALIQFVSGAEGRPIMRKFGFLLPGEF
jgi:molybdate transport system substrate-binding protein